MLIEEEDLQKIDEKKKKGGVREKREGEKKVFGIRERKKIGK